MPEKEVFVTYSWDDKNHQEKVISFTNYLRQKGFNAEIDKILIQRESAIDFKKMMHKAMTDYPKVIVVLSEGYKEKAEKFKGGVGNEYGLILNDIENNNNKYILVSFEGIKDNIIPLFFKNREIIDLSKNDNEEIQKLFAKLQNEIVYSFDDVAPTKPVVSKKPISNFINTDIHQTNQIEFKGISLEDLCNKLKLNSNINILKTLNLPLSKFTDVTNKINDNPADRENGVIAAYIKRNLNLFDIFDYSIHKIYKNGNKQYFFYTETKDIQKITNVSEILYKNLGCGIYDNRVRYSFKDIEHIKDIANGFSTSEKEDCQTLWLVNKRFTVFLEYHTKPLQQFVLSIDEKRITKKSNISRNDSLFNYINFDLNSIVKNSVEHYREIQNNEIKYIDYLGILPNPFLDVFTRINIRIFGDKKEFNEEIQTNLFFYTQNNILRLDDIKTTTQKIISIYGRDNTNSEELKDYEIQNINEFGSWLGRSYDFNTQHRLIDFDKKEEIFLYSVLLDYDESTEDGLCLSVIAFNNLVKYNHS